MEIVVKHEIELVFELKGRLDTQTSVELDKSFKEQTINEHVVVLDFKELEYISSAGLRVILAIKKSLEDDGEETNLKFLFTGKENIFEVKEITEKLIKENKKVEVQNGIDKLANALGALPYGIIIPLVSFLKWLDKYRIITK